MSYYQGDYYRGDYYQGGIPFLVAGVGALAKRVLPKAGAAIGRGAAKVFGKGGGGRVLKAGGAVVATGAGFELGARGVKKVLGGGEEGMGRRRRMNVANPKALRRAIRRAHGFAKLARSVLSFPISKPPRGRPLFKKARRR